MRTTFECGLPLLLTDGLRVHVHRSPDVRVPQQLLLYFHIDSTLSQHGGIGMPKRMPADVFSESRPETDVQVDLPPEETAVLRSGVRRLFVRTGKDPVMVLSELGRSFPGKQYFSQHGVEGETRL